MRNARMRRRWIVGCGLRATVRQNTDMHQIYSCRIRGYALRGAARAGLRVRQSTRATIG